MFTVGLTGGIGSGKTTVAHVFETLGVPVYYCDWEARKLMNSTLQKSVTELIGAEAYNQYGQANSKVIASKVFADPALLARLNAIVHPAVEHDFIHWRARQNAPYVILETALLAQSGIATDLIITVTAPLAMRVERTCRRDKCTAEHVELRIAAQMPQEVMAKTANYVITTDDGHLVTPQILAIHQKILSVVK